MAQPIFTKTIFTSAILARVTNSKHAPLWAALVTIILWSFAFPASRAALPYFSVEQVVLLRYVFACGFYILLFTFGTFKLPQLKDLPLLFVLGLLGITCYQLLFVFGMGKVSGGAAAMIITANPVCAALLARVFLSEKLSGVAWIGITLSILGVGIISLLKGSDGAPLGYLALLIAVLSISIYFVFQKPFFNRYTPLEMTSYTCIAGTLPLLIFLPETIQAVTIAPWPPIIWILAMGIFSSGIGFLLWIYALSKLRAGIVTSFLFLQPVFVTLLSWVWLNEIPESKTFIGGGIVLIGVMLIVREQLSQQKNKIKCALE